MGLPIVELADYMETTALGRAEWVKFYGLLWGAEKQADSLFSNTEKEYMRLKDLAKKAKYSPSVMMDKVENGVWYLPGGKSTISQTQLSPMNPLFRLLPLTAAMSAGDKSVPTIFVCTSCFFNIYNLSSDKIAFRVEMCYNIDN